MYLQLATVYVRVDSRSQRCQTFFCANILRHSCLTLDVYFHLLSLFLPGQSIFLCMYSSLTILDSGCWLSSGAFLRHYNVTVICLSCTHRSFNTIIHVQCYGPVYSVSSCWFSTFYMQIRF